MATTTTLPFRSTVGRKHNRLYGIIRQATLKHEKMRSCLLIKSSLSTFSCQAMRIYHCCISMGQILIDCNFYPKSHNQAIVLSMTDVRVSWGRPISCSSSCDKEPRLLFGLSTSSITEDKVYEKRLVGGVIDWRCSQQYSSSNIICIILRQEMFRMPYIRNIGQ